MATLNFKGQKMEILTRKSNKYWLSTQDLLVDRCTTKPTTPFKTILVEASCIYLNQLLYVQILFEEIQCIYSATGLESRKLFSFAKTIHLMCISILPSLDAVPYM